MIGFEGAAGEGGGGVEIVGTGPCGELTECPAVGINGTL